MIFISYGFLEFQDGEAANRIYEKMQGLIINGCAIKLDKIVDKEHLPKTAEGNKGEEELSQNHGFEAQFCSIQPK